MGWGGVALILVFLLLGLYRGLWVEGKRVVPVWEIHRWAKESACQACREKRI